MIVGYFVVEDLYFSYFVPWNCFWLERCLWSSNKNITQKTDWNSNMSQMDYYQNEDEYRGMYDIIFGINQLDTGCIPKTRCSLLVMSLMCTSGEIPRRSGINLSKPSAFCWGDDSFVVLCWSLHIFSLSKVSDPTDRSLKSQALIRALAKIILYFCICIVSEWVGSKLSDRRTSRLS